MPVPLRVTPPGASPSMPPAGTSPPQASKATALPTAPHGHLAAPRPAGPCPSDFLSPTEKGPAPRPAGPRRWKRWCADVIKATAALFVLVLAAAIWYQPPLFRSASPTVSYTFQGKIFTDATLYRPLAMPTRYYIRLPHELARRYAWFAVDRRREVVALLEKPPHRRFFNAYAVRRGDPFGLDLEFTKIDGLEWQVAFHDQSVVFSNAILSVRLDGKTSSPAPKRVR